MSTEEDYSPLNTAFSPHSNVTSNHQSVREAVGGSRRITPPLNVHNALCDVPLTLPLTSAVKS